MEGGVEGGVEWGVGEAKARGKMRREGEAEKAEDLFDFKCVLTHLVVIVIRTHLVVIT
jgi:hypothetical protein